MILTLVPTTHAGNTKKLKTKHTHTSSPLLPSSLPFRFNFVFFHEDLKTICVTFYNYTTTQPWLLRMSSSLRDLAVFKRALGCRTVVAIVDNDSVTNFDMNMGTRGQRILTCLLYTSDAADEEDSVDLGGRRIIKKNKKHTRVARTYGLEIL
eukprot:TRINITY_DN49524_c0_g1_i1.p1 TRINITY_DN49524_c0_g1~~TRINITY_DN49524_c0_g1_i1.p1  ORF type:complete len:152 (-),score=7.72 TRINITY_DN49524_c0_g1_i1:39-494(-)